MKDSIYRMMVDIWRLASKYNFCKMGDKEWEDFIRSGQKLAMRYRPQGEAVEKLCRALFSAFQDFFEKFDTGSADED